MIYSLVLPFLSLLLCDVYAWQALPQIPSGRRTQFLVQNEDGGYKYGYDTGNGSAAKQSSDSTNEVQGHYFYRSPSGQSTGVKYTAGVQGFLAKGLGPASDGFAPTAGAYSSGVHMSSPRYYTGADKTASSGDQAGTRDASYSFSIDTDTYKRHETSDAGGNIQGRYSYTNNAGVHDLQYVAGESTGFVATSGSLSLPNGFRGEQEIQGFRAHQTPADTSSLPLSQGYTYDAPVSTSTQIRKSEGGYAYSYTTDDSSKQESSDSSGNVQGRYTYQNDAGTHDLSYVAGAQTGFVPTGGSLATPSGQRVYPTSIIQTYTLPVVSKARIPANSVLASSSGPSEDGSYSFSYNTGDQSRQESSDSFGNVQGRYAYNDQAGGHDLTYFAGANTGFTVTGGSLTRPKGLENNRAVATINSGAPKVTQAYLPPSPPTELQAESINGGNYDGNRADTADASYSFAIDTPGYKRQETSDASGNVEGSYSYSDAAGNHDLNFRAGSNTGFLPTSGSLKTPPGLSETQLKSAEYGGYSSAAKSSVIPLVHGSVSPNSGLPSTQPSYRLGNTIVHTYLPPSNEKQKFGYVFETV